MTNLLSQTWFIFLMGATLIGAVLSAVHHAEVIAHKTGEPYGTLVLSISVTIIEVSLIISMMLTGHEGSEFIARDAVFATANDIGNALHEVAFGLVVVVLAPAEDDDPFELRGIEHVKGVSDMSSLAAWTNEQFDPRLSWADVAWVKERWGGKLILKGIMEVEDAVLAAQAGAARGQRGAKFSKSDRLLRTHDDERWRIRARYPFNAQGFHAFPCR